MDCDTLATAQTLSCHASSQNSRNMILSSYDGTMAEWTTHIGNYPCSKRKEWRPGGRRDSCHRDNTLPRLVGLSGTENDPRQAGDTARAGVDSFTHLALVLVGVGRT